MANKHASLDALFTDIADVIREKTGETGAIAAAQIPSVIRNKLQAAPVGFYVSTPQGYSEFVPITPGQTFYDFINSDNNTGKFRINGMGLNTFLEMYFIDESMDSAIVKNNNYGLKPVWDNMPPEMWPYCVDQNGNDISQYDASISVLSDDWCNHYGIDPASFIEAGASVNTRLNRILVSGDTSSIGDGVWTVEDIENHVGKPLNQINIITTIPIAVFDNGGILGTSVDYALFVPAIMFDLGFSNVIALVTSFQNPSALDDIMVDYIEADSVDYESNYVRIPLGTDLLEAMATTPCIVSIIG